jgi:hypothetical protein
VKIYTLLTARREAQFSPQACQVLSRQEIVLNSEGISETQVKTISRRSFLQTFVSGLGSSLMVAFGITPSRQTTPATGKSDKSTPVTFTAKVDKLNLAAFRSNLNSQFQVHTASKNVTMNLIAVTDLRASATQRGEAFSLLFETASGQPLSQGTYSFNGAQMGKFDLFMVPASNNGLTQRYEAHFNRLEVA